MPQNLLGEEITWEDGYCTECGNRHGSIRGLYAHVVLHQNHTDSDLYDRLARWQTENIKNIPAMVDKMEGSIPDGVRQKQLQKHNKMAQNGNHPFQRDHIRDKAEKMCRESGGYERIAEKASVRMEKLAESGEHPFQKTQRGPNMIEVEETGHTVLSTWEKDIDIMLYNSKFNYVYAPGPYNIRGSTYTPDFKVSQNIIEVKGRVREHDIQRASNFMGQHPQYRYIAIGSEIPCDIHIPWSSRSSLLEVL